MRESGKLHRYVIEELAPAFLREGVSEARLCSEICTAIVDRGGMGISRYNQPAAEDVLGIASFSENSLRPTALDSPSGCIGTSTAMKSIGSSERTLHEGDTVLLDIPCGWRGYHTDKSITFYYGELDKHPQSGVIRAAREQCIALENETASLLRAGAVPAEIYAEDPLSRRSCVPRRLYERLQVPRSLHRSDNGRNTGSRQRLLGSARVRHDACR